MSTLKRGMVIEINLDPTKGQEINPSLRCVIVTNDTYNEHLPIIQVVPLTAWSEKRAHIVTNVEIAPTGQNGLDKACIADCLQTRPIDHRNRLVNVRGLLDDGVMREINKALNTVFAI